MITCDQKNEKRKENNKTRHSSCYSGYCETQLTAYFQREILILLCLINKNKSVTFNKIRNRLTISVLNVNKNFFINNINFKLPSYI